jgi:hypothetical protein
MLRGKKFDIAEKAKIMARFYENIAPKKIGARLKINRDKKSLSATPPPPKKWRGQHGLSSFRQQERLHQYVLQFPFKTGRKLKAEVQGWSNMSVRTIQRVFKQKLGLLSCCAAKKPLLMAKMLKKRIAFCKKHCS